MARESLLRHRTRWPATAASLWQIGMAYRWRKEVAGGASMKARLDALALRLMAAVPYVYAVLLGMLLQQLFGGAK
jgi:hypothetical protein